MPKIFKNAPIAKNAQNCQKQTSTNAENPKIAKNAHNWQNHLKIAQNSKND